MSGIEFEVLPGLSGSGPAAVPFPASNSGISEGFIVRFQSSSSGTWTGNFRPGDTGHSAVHLHPDGKRVIVIAGGSDYLVNPDTKCVEGQTAANISFSHAIPDLETVVFGDHVRFWAEGRNGRKWTTPRLSWDGIETTRIIKGVLVGKCYSAVDEMWHEFSLDLASGDTTGAIFEADLRRVNR